MNACVCVYIYVCAYVQALNDARDQQLVKLREEMEAQADNVRYVNARVYICVCICTSSLLTTGHITRGVGSPGRQCKTCECVLVYDVHMYVHIVRQRVV